MAGVWIMGRAHDDLPSFKLLVPSRPKNNFTDQLPENHAKCLRCHQTEKKMLESDQRLLRQPRVRAYTPPIGDALCV